VLTLATLKKVAREYGATVEDDSSGESIVYAIIAPKGKCWVEGHLHTLMIEWEPRQNLPWWKQAEIKDAIERMRYGLLDCPLDCECFDE
jgi:hypothetical protein